MIQRIQSVFFIMSSILTSIVLYFYLHVARVCSCVMLPHSCEVESCTNLIVPQIVHYALVGLFALQIGLSLVALFAFKNRRLQMKLASVVAVLIVVSGGVLTYVDSFGFIKSMALILLAVSLVFVLLARYRVKKDDDLVRSADRIR